MKRELKVIEYSKKQRLLDAVNSNSDKIEIVTITGSQSNGSFQHFLWYYDAI